MVEGSQSQAVLQREIGKYALRRQLGAGASGVVYLAEDRSLGREVALKVLHPQLARDQDFLRRFKREARLIASLSHPHIVRVHAFDAIDGQFVIETEYMPGGPLSERCARSVFDGPTIARIARDILSALTFCHSREILHRDIKPSNVLLDDAGNAQVADFGLAKAHEALGEGSLGAQTSTGVFLGTPRYAPPEAWEGKELSPQSDLYALGIVLHEMVTGRPPYDALTPLALMREMLTSPVLRLDPDSTGLSKEITGLVNALVQWETDKRPMTAQEALDQLLASPEGATLTSPLAMLETQRLLTKELPRAPQSHSGRRAGLRTRRHVLTLGGALAIAATAFVLGRQRPQFETPQSTLGLTRRLLDEALRDGIPTKQELRGLWRDPRAEVYSAYSLTSDGTDAATSLYWGTTGDTDSRAILLRTPDCLYSLELKGSDGTISGHWASFENTTNTALRYGTVAGMAAGNVANGSRTVTLERVCEQYQLIEGETWHLEPTADTSDTGVLLDLESSTTAQLLLFDELSGRGFQWARDLESRLPAIAGARLRAVGVETPFDSQQELRFIVDKVLSDAVRSDDILRGVPRTIGAVSAAAHDDKVLLIVFKVEGMGGKADFFRVVLGTIPCVSPRGERLATINLLWERSEATIARDNLEAQDSSEWGLTCVVDNNDFYAVANISLDSIPAIMRRRRWRMNATMGRRKEDGEVSTLLTWGAPAVLEVEHGAILEFDETLAGWR